MCAWLFRHVQLFETPSCQPGSSVHGDSPGKNPAMGCHFLLQRIFPTQGSNLSLLRLLRYRQLLYPLSQNQLEDGFTAAGVWGRALASIGLTRAVTTRGAEWLWLWVAPCSLAGQWAGVCEAGCPRPGPASQGEAQEGFLYNAQLTPPRPPQFATCLFFFFFQLY